MARSNGSRDSDDFERAWEAITEQLGDLGPAEPFGDEKETRRGRRASPEPTGAGSPAGEQDRAPDGGTDGWGGDAPFAMGGPRDYEPPPDEGFVPPEPAPIVVYRRPWLVVGWCGLVASALVLLACGIFRAAIPVTVPQIAGGGLLISLIVLFTQLPKGKRDPDDPDKGAVV